MTRRDIVEQEYRNDENLRKEDVLKLVQWVQDQQHLPQITEQEAIWFLQSNYYNEDAAKTTIDKHFTLKTQNEDMLRNRNVRNERLKATMSSITFSVLSKKTPEGYSVVLTHFQDKNPQLFNFNDIIKLFDMITTLDLYHNGTHKGLLYCIDLEGFSFGHSWRINPISAKRFVSYLQEGMPIRLKGLHLFNASSIVEKALMLFKPFMSKEVLEMLHTYPSINEVTKIVPLENFPKDYGGEYDPLIVLHENMKNYFNDNAEFFAYQDTQIVDETLRPGKRSYFGMFSWA